MVAPFPLAALVSMLGSPASLGLLIAAAEGRAEERARRSENPQYARDDCAYAGHAQNAKLTARRRDKGEIC